MMEYTRKTTLDEVQNLSIEGLDYLYADDANSIGMLLAHMASVEKFYQIDTFEKRDITEEDVALFNPALQLGDRAREEIKGQFIEVYVNELAEVRKKMIETFMSLPESWLFKQKPFFGGHPTNNYFKWFHVFEDEISYRGQIRLIKKMKKK